MINVILCGGSGTRLWPLSRQSKPKQFIGLLQETTLLQRTAKANQAVTTDCVVICNEAHSHLVQQQLSACSVTPLHYLFEPEGRNSAAAVCIALLALEREDIAFITPADLYIEYSDAYYQAIKQAKELAKNNKITVFGIAPDKPETGYGYIELSPEGTVRRFHEKPNVALAKQYLSDGNYFWNSGMLCAKVGTLLDSLQKHAPDIYEKSLATFQNANVVSDASTMYYFPIEHMLKIPDISIDYALLEKLDELKMVKGNFIWSDVGNFDAMYKHLKKDKMGNAGNSNNITINSENNLIIGTSRLIATVDIKDLIIVDTPDALLISKRGSGQKVKDVVAKLDNSISHLQKTHVEESKPWGSFTVLEKSSEWKVKKLTILPGKRLSLQKHKYRSEHWVVVSGIAFVTVGNKQTYLHPNQSIYISQDEIHRIENPGTEPLNIIETQCGSYTSEDDIIRFQDDFKGSAETYQMKG